MPSPHVAAVLAARANLELFPTYDGPCVLQAVGRHALLSCCVVSVDVALPLADLVAPIVATAGLILVADAYHEAVALHGADPSCVPEPARGDLARRFDHGDRAVTEALLVHSAWRDAPSQLTILPYVRTESIKGPGIQWLPSPDGDHDDTGGSGRVPDALRAALAKPRRLLPGSMEAATMGVLADSLGAAGMVCDVLDLPDTIDLRD